MTSQTFQKNNQLLLPKKAGAFFIFVIIVLFSLSFGYGYFIGRYEQIDKNKTMLKNIPDVNCGRA